MEDVTELGESLVREASILSPLRYPGAKRRLTGYIAEVLRINSIRPTVFIEPFAGSASVALQLLQDNFVDYIALGEKDELIASFWKVVFEDTQWLIDKIKSIEPTVDEWKRYKHTYFRSNRDRALACLFLNRTSFSGIMAPGAGPIGGLSQKSEYKIDCRFNVKTITKRIEQASALADKVKFVHHGDWSETMNKASSRFSNKEDVFYYLDPPFYNKSSRLYRYCFTHSEHKSLHNRLVNLDESWLLSYDSAPEIIDMYSHNGSAPRKVDLLYSISAAAELVRAQELMITNLSALPTETRLWRSAEEWSVANYR